VIPQARGGEQLEAGLQLEEAGAAAGSECPYWRGQPSGQQQAEVELSMRGGLPGASLPGKLGHWLEKVTENMKKITAKMPDVGNWSIEVRLPAGVSITVTFKPGDP
jgi:hypothetical protein